MSFVYLSSYVEYVGRFVAESSTDYLALFISGNRQSGTQSYHFIINPFNESVINYDVF